VQYKFISDPEQANQLGFIAQEVEPIFPEVVQTGKDGFKSMVYSNLVAPLVEAVKSLYQRIQGIEQKQSAQSREIASKADQTSVDAKAKMLEAELAQLKEADRLKNQKIETLEKRLEQIEKMLKSK
jgi:predicted RNase H-like nuclease (RuvC/YqgF family)